jgi:riboflavin kinase / FMN adenylyltransferase
VQRWTGLDAIPDDVGACVVSIGVFDGVHRGHRSILKRAVDAAKERDALSVVVTFDPHPAKVVGRPVPLTLTDLHKRTQLLADVGIDRVVVLPFTREISEWAPEEFVQRLLVDRLHVVHIVVGENFRFGHKQAGDVELLARMGTEYGFTVDAVDLLAALHPSNGDGVPVSSTWIRGRIAVGDVAAAAGGLGYLYSVSGPVVRGNGRGKPMGYPTANVDVAEDIAVPADGIYAGWLVRAPSFENPFGPRVRLPAAISIGTNPTFDGTERRVEAFVIDVVPRDSLDLYGERVSVEFVEWLRGMVRFEGVEPLIEQMADDVRRTREVLAAASGQDPVGSTGQ